MHPRNPYRTPPNFEELAQVYEPLRRHLLKTASGGMTINFKDELAQRYDLLKMHKVSLLTAFYRQDRTLTKALLHRDFSLRLSIPSDRLCPPVPNRLNYVLWIQDIVQVARSCEPSNLPVQGVDIGTGASAIYPLLLCRLAPEWNMLGTEIDEHSLHYARENVELNDLRDRITVLPASGSGPILPSPGRGICFDFVMCNPPFYNSAEDIARSAEIKDFEPSAVCTGAETEMITEGGESRFVGKMVEESLHMRKRCLWYTSMLGKLSSVSEVVALLRLNNIDNYGITEFVQGQTRRWAIAWSFGDVRLPDTLARISNPTLRLDMPPHTILREPVPPLTQLSTLQALLESIPGISVLQDSNSPGFLCSASANTWSRAARRKFVAGSIGFISSDVPLLVSRVTLEQAGGSGVLEIVWTRGKDRGTFESFASHIARKVRDAP